jgi:hypothetical protein
VGQDTDFLADVGDRVMQDQFDAESLTASEREQTVIDAFKRIEAEHQS